MELSKLPLWVDKCLEHSWCFSANKNRLIQLTGILLRLLSCSEKNGSAISGADSQRFKIVESGTWPKRVVENNGIASCGPRIRLVMAYVQSIYGEGSCPLYRQFIYIVVHVQQVLSDLQSVVLWSGLTISPIETKEIKLKKGGRILMVRYNSLTVRWALVTDLSI